jgi:hypothetical protein
MARVPRARRRRRRVRRPHRGGRPGERTRRSRGRRGWASGGPGIHRPAHPLRSPAHLGPHCLVHLLARRHHHRHGQLRLHRGPLPAPGPPHAHEDAGVRRGHVAGGDAEGHAVEFETFSRPGRPASPRSLGASGARCPGGVRHITGGPARSSASPTAGWPRAWPPTLRCSIPRPSRATRGDRPRPAGRGPRYIARASGIQWSFVGGQPIVRRRLPDSGEVAGAGRVIRAA